MSARFDYKYNSKKGFLIGEIVQSSILLDASDEELAFSKFADTLLHNTNHTTAENANMQSERR